MKRIMALIDFSEATSNVVHLARDMARAFNSELMLLNVNESESDFVDGEVQDDTAMEAQATPSRHREMEILGVVLKKEGVNVVTHIAKSPWNGAGVKILEEVARFSPDLIVMGSHGHGRIHKLVCGSVADSVLRRAACPVTIVPKSQSKKNSPA